MKASILTVFSLLVSMNSMASSFKGSLYPSVSLTAKVIDLGADECVKRILPGDTENFTYHVAIAYSSLAIDTTGSLSSFMEDTVKNGSKYSWSQFVPSNNYANKKATFTAFIMKNDGTLRKATGTVTAKVSPIANIDADVSMLNLPTLLPLIDDIDASLGGIPNAIIGGLNDVVNGLNERKNALRNSRKTRETIKVGDVTEARIQAAQDIMITAQVTNLLTFACNDADMSKQAASLKAYLLKTSGAINSILSK